METTKLQTKNFVPNLAMQEPTCTINFLNAFFWGGGGWVLYVFLTPPPLPGVPLVGFRVCPLTP